MLPSNRSKYLIETSELANLLSEGKELTLIDATKGGANDHLEKRITDDTRFFDHGKVADLSSKLPLTFPNVETFVKEMKAIDV